MADLCYFLSSPSVSDTTTDSTSSGTSRRDSGTHKRRAPSMGDDESEGINPMQHKKEKWKTRAKELVDVLNRNGYDVDYM